MILVINGGDHWHFNATVFCIPLTHHKLKSQGMYGVSWNVKTVARWNYCKILYSRKKTLFFKNKYPEPALRLVWKNQKGFLIQTKFGGSARQFWGEGSPKSVLVFLHHAVLSVPIKCLPEMVVVHLLSGHLFDFSPLCVFSAFVFCVFVCRPIVVLAVNKILKT